MNNTIRAPNRKFIPAANTKSLNKDFKILYQDGTTVKVTGRDLVYAIPDNLVQQNGSDVITVIPANPCYWSGTRISALAQGYQNYRPLAMKFSYIPQCAVTQQGNVIAGTLWNQAPSNDNLQQSLRTSNGGQLSQCYKSFTSVVRLKSNLQFNLYKTAGQFDQESNPFIFMSIAVGCKNTQGNSIIPGYYYVTWSFLLKNPIGNTNVFYNSGITEYSQISDNYENKTVIFLTPGDDEIQRGTVLQIEDDEQDQKTAYYNGSAYEIKSDDLVWFFANSLIQQTNALQKRSKKTINFQYQTTIVESPNIFTQVLIFEDPENPDSWLIWQPQNYVGGDFIVENIFPGQRDKIFYFMNDDIYGMNPFPIFNFGQFIGMVNYPSDRERSYAYRTPKDETVLAPYSTEQMEEQPRNKKLQSRKLNKTKKPNSIVATANNNIQLVKHTEAEESIADLFEEVSSDINSQQKKQQSKDTHEGSNHCIVARPPGKTKSDGYLKQEFKATSLKTRSTSNNQEKKNKEENIQ